MVTRYRIVAVDQIISHEVDVVDEGSNFFPVDGCCEVGGEAARCKADLVLAGKFFSKFLQQQSEVLFVIRREWVSGDAGQGRVFPVEIDAVGVEEVCQLPYRSAELPSSFFCGEDAAAGPAPCPSSHGEDHFQPGVPGFEANDAIYNGAIVGAGNDHPVAPEVTEAENDMGQFIRRKAIEVEGFCGIIGDDGGGALGGGRRRVLCTDRKGQAGQGEYDKKFILHGGACWYHRCRNKVSK
jgi:hypothetical protein